jgi:hypothetical protein
MLADLDNWIICCRKLVDASEKPPYLDDIYPELGEVEPGDRPWNKMPEEFWQAAERLLSNRPSDLALRFALLYLADPSIPRVVLGKEKEQQRGYFRHLMALCIPEELTDLRTLKFELHNSYLASDWGLTKQLLGRLDSLEILSTGEMKALERQRKYGN